MTVIPIESLDDPRIADYRNLKDRELARRGDLFIAEGEHVVRRLLASSTPVVSMLLAERRVADVAPLAPPDVPIYSISDPLMTQVLGFKFHSGVIAVGRRPRPRKEWIEMCCDPGDSGGSGGPRTLLVCPQIINHENLGSLMRIAAAFGVDGFVLGPESCDPYWRRSIRVSMGTIFSLNLVRSQDLESDLRTLRDRYGFELAATVLDEDAQPLHTVARPPRLALLLGNEAQGLDRRWVDLCDRRITIPMKLGTDSLNVSVAAAVFLYHFTRNP